MNNRTRTMLMLGGLGAALDAGQPRGKHAKRSDLKNYSSAKARARARKRRALAKAGRKAARRRKK